MGKGTHSLEPLLPKHNVAVLKIFLDPFHSDCLKVEVRWPTCSPTMDLEQEGLLMATWSTLSLTGTVFDVIPVLYACAA